MLYLYDFNGEHYAEYSKVDLQGKVTEAVPVTHEVWAQLIHKAKMAKKKKELKGMAQFEPYTISPAHLHRILRLSTYETHLNLTWIRPEQRTIIKVLNQKDQDLVVPNMIFSVHGQSISVFMYKKAEKLDNSTKLYMPPFGNLHGHDIVCTGNVKLPKTMRIDHFMDLWEAVYFNSNFTSLLNSAYVEPKNMLEHWKKEKHLDEKYYKSADLILNDIYQQHHAHIE